MYHFTDREAWQNESTAIACKSAKYVNREHCKIPTLCLLGIMQYLTNNSHSGTNTFFSVRYKNLIYRHKGEAVTQHWVFSLLSQNVAPVELSYTIFSKKLNTELQPWTQLWPSHESANIQLKVNYLTFKLCQWGVRGQQWGELSVVFLAERGGGAAEAQTRRNWLSLRKMKDDTCVH